MRLSIVAASLLIAVSAAGAKAQGTPSAPRPANAVGEIRGTLTDSTNGQAVTRGSITIRRMKDTSFVGGALPKPDGSFRVEGLLPGQYTLRFRAIGLSPVTKNDLVITVDKPVVNVGEIKLAAAVTKLEGQEITAERDQEVLSPDRNVYSTKNMTTAAGGTAIDVLKNIPLVEVDQSNKVSLRNNGNVVVQINGRSTPLKGDQLGMFLSQLPASQVKHVEVATNPSAKDDPEGTAGIINIVLKQDVELGLSGGVNAGTASTGQVNFSGNVGKQQGKFTAFLSGSLYRDTRNTSGTISRTNLVNPTPAFVETLLAGSQRPFGTGGNLRTEYRLNEIDAITFDSYFWGGSFEGRNASYYTNLDQSRAVTGLFNQLSVNTSKYMSTDFDLAFRRTGKPNTPSLTAEIEYGDNPNSGTNNLSLDLIQADASMPADRPAERDRNSSHYPSANAKVDYSRPLTKSAKIESGFKATWRKTVNDFTAAYQDPVTGEFEINPARSTGLDYRETIVGGYGLFSQRFRKMQLQTGLRLENADTHFTVASLSKNFDKTYHSLYPSAVLSYNFTDLRQAKLSYSRRISRPNPWQLNPIEYKQDDRHVFRGNPDIGAEYTNSFDLSLQEGRAWGSVQLTSYLRRTDHAVRNIQSIDSTGISVGTFLNVANTQTLGSDLNVNVRKGPLQLYLSGSAYQYKSDASNLSGNLSAEDIIWSVRMNGTWKFSPLFDMQVGSNYRPAFKTEGGTQLASSGFNFSARYKVWGDKGNISLRVSDPFKLSKYGYRTSNGFVLESTERYGGSRAVYLSINRNFGQALRLKPRSEPDAPQTGGPPGG
jgi:outer membrane cobalamin receptor